MKATSIKPKEFFILTLAAIVLSRSFATIQGGDQTAGFLGFFVLFFLSFLLLRLSYGWAGGGETLGVIIALAFVLRLGVGVGLYLGLPVYGHSDADDRAGCRIPIRAPQQSQRRRSHKLARSAPT